MRVAPDGLKADNFNALVPSIGSMVGGGDVDSKNQLDFKMVATLTQSVLANTASPVSSATGMLGKVMGGAGGAGGCKQGMTVPFQIKGTTSDPKFIPDVGNLAAGMLKSQLGCAGGLAGAAGSTGIKTPQDAAGALGQLGGLFKKKEALTATTEIGTHTFAGLLSFSRCRQHRRGVKSTSSELLR